MFRDYDMFEEDFDELFDEECQDEEFDDEKVNEFGVPDDFAEFYDKYDDFDDEDDEGYRRKGLSRKLKLRAIGDSMEDELDDEDYYDDGEETDDDIPLLYAIITIPLLAVCAVVLPVVMAVEDGAFWIRQKAAKLKSCRSEAET